MRLLLLLLIVADASPIHCHESAKRLYDDLLINYNKLRRPTRSSSEPLTIKLKLRLSQIIDVHEKDQIMTTSVWLIQEWYDQKLTWNPENYGGVKILYVPAEMIWVPDIVLYNNADSNYNITITTKATIRFNGTVLWEPPAIYKSMCPIDIQWFPFDDQLCRLKFGSWTFHQQLLDLQHMHPRESIVRHREFDAEKNATFNVSTVYRAIDISDYYPSVEWDILEVPGHRNEKNYPSCCPEIVFVDITYDIKLRRKPLFYTVNLIFPCVGISFLTILVFYLPSDSGEKVTLCISILVSLTVFFLLLTEIIPATSIVLPLIGKYLLFTMVMVTLSVMVTVMVLNLHFRTPTTHRMPKWVDRIFLHILPKMLFMRRPPGRPQFRQPKPLHPYIHPPDHIREMYSAPQVLKAFDNVRFIAEVLRKKDRNYKVDEDWKYVAMVMDRLFLWIFSLSCFLGTVSILLQAPAFYDYTRIITQHDED